MIKYICKHCDDLECNSSTCPVCGERTTLVSSEIYYCPEWNAPVFDADFCKNNSKCIKIGTDVRPVFAEERLLLECFLDKPMEFAGKSVWQTTSNTYWIDGKKHRVSLADFHKKNPEDIIKMMQDFKEENQKYVDADFSNEHIVAFAEANKTRLNQITDEACDYIRKMASQFDMSEIFVSFSGGKDSTVTSDLVMKAMETESVLHIYGDTTLEYPTSEKYIKEFLIFF